MCKVIIDVDSFMYKAASTCNTLVELQKGLYYEAYDINKAKEYLDETISNIMGRTSTNDYVLVTGGVGKNFRYRVCGTYKSNRKKTKRPIMLDKVREMMFENYPVAYIPHLEADDTCRILYEQGGECIASIDKDLCTFEVKLYDPYHDTMRMVSKQQGEANFKRQLLMGDSTDGYNGIPGVGKATADKLILSGITVDEIAEMYVDKGLSLDEFKTTYNCAKILGKDDYNNGVISLYGGEKLDASSLE